jgi:hypothetical protein
VLNKLLFQLVGVCICDVFHRRSWFLGSFVVGLLCLMGLVVNRFNWSSLSDGLSRK